ncbi:MAG: sugar phosphate isomerase/epimerase [Dongiaceae bacterium]
MLAGFHSVALHRDPIALAIDKVAAAGYRGIELNAETLPWAKPHVTPETPAAARQAIAARCAAAGLAITAVGAHIPMLFESAAERRQAIDYVNGCIALARDVGSPVVHILSGEQPAGAGAAESWRWFADAVAECGAAAKAAGVALAVEAIAGHRFHAVADYAQLQRDLPGTDVRVNFDPSHLFVQGEDPLRLVAEQAGRIAHMHAKDGKGRFPDFAFPPLGQGAIDFTALFAALRRAGYDGPVSVEYEAQEFGYHEPEATVLSHGKAFLAGLGVAA